MGAPDAPRPGEPPPAEEAGLLERGPELELLGALLATASSGSGRLLLVEGEAGIGKTELLRALAAEAASDGAAVLRARGGELERELPYGVARQLFEPVARAAPGRRRVLLDGAAGPAAAALGLSADPEPGVAGEEGSLAASHALYWLAANLADESPLVLVVDDAHWADPATLRFLHYLGRRLEGVPVLAALAFRPAEPGAPSALLEALRDVPEAALVRPLPLSVEASAAVIRAAAGRAASDSFAVACHEATGGNPFLLGELLRALSLEGVEPEDDAVEYVGRLGPRSISRSVLRRLAVTGPEAIALACAVAVLDTDAELAHAAALARIPLPEAAIAADALTEAHVFAAGRPLRFAHPIIRRAVYEDLAHGRRALDHARAAAILEEAGQPDRAAVHLLATEPAGDAAVVERLRAVARRALERGAPAEALAFLRRAEAEPPPPGERPAVLLELGCAARQAGDEGAAASLREALDRADDLRARMAAARELAAALTTAGDLDGATAVLGAQVDELPADAREERFLLEAELLTAGTFDDALARQAAARIETLLPQIGGSTPAERVLLAGAAFHRVAAGTASGAEVARLAERAAAGFRIVDEQSAASLYPTLAAACLLFTDRHELAAGLIDEMSADARRRGSPTAFAWVSTMRARLEHVLGDQVAAEDHSRGALDLFPSTLTLGTEMALAFLTFALVEQGRLGEAARVLAEYGVEAGPLSRTTSGLTLLLARSALHLDAGRLPEARADAEEVVRREGTRGGSLPGRGFRWSPAPALRSGGDPDAARRVAAEHARRARTFDVPSVEGIALLVLGVVTGGERGLRHLERAAAVLEGSPRRLDHAHGLVELGAARRRANRRSDAREPLRRGMDLAHRLGARPLAERARQELLACGARPRRPILTGVDSLTASERRVAQMAAGGMSNPEIAQALFVTRKTVEAHLLQTYRKLGIASREELPGALGGDP